jgi:acyl-CoA dehydrogenase family member 9
MSVAKHQEQLFPYPRLRDIALATQQEQARKQVASAIGEFGLVRETIFEGTNEVLRLYIALSGLKDLGKSLGELSAAVDDIFNNFIKGFGSQGLREAAGVYERYTVELAKAPEFLSRAASIPDTSGEESVQATGVARVFAQQANRRMANAVRRITRNEDEEMDRLAGFMLDKGRYPWDVMQ